MQKNKGLTGLLADRLQSPLFLTGAGIYSAASNGDDIGTGIMQGTQLANQAQNAQMKRALVQKQLNAKAKGPAPTANMREFAFAKQQGFKGSFMDFKNAARQNAGQTTYGRSGGIFQGRDGQFYTVQFASDGSRKILPVQADGQDLAPARGVQQVGDVLIDKSTGEAVRNVAENIAGGEEAKAVGTHKAELTATMPKARGQMLALEQQHALVGDTIDRVLPKVNEWTTGIPGATLSQVPGTAQNDVRRLIETIKGNIGFDKLQQMRELSPTGGALGQVAVQELQYLQGVLGNLEQSQTADQLRTNLTQVKKALQDMKGLRQRAFEDTYNQVAGGATRAGPQPPPEAVEMLRQSPDKARQFDEIFGAGAAQRVLGGG